MSKNPFGWSLPPGVTQKMIDDHFGGTSPDYNPHESGDNEPDFERDEVAPDNTEDTKDKDDEREQIEGEAYIYKTDGTVEHRTYTSPPTLEGLQEAVGGYIETVPYLNKHKGKRCVAFCNEEGKLHKLPLNITATKLWIESGAFTHIADDILVGDIIILQGNQLFLESL